ncbi:MAG: oligosaccharide flippase family protein [Muribaculaceae bacterium]|nr:oligosaccharide flippase family protein [Muribaculaceae bacterium]
MKIQKKAHSLGTGRNQKPYKSNMAVSTGILAYILYLILRIPLARVIGDAGVGLSAPAFECIALVTLLFSYGISRTMAGLIRYRVKREQFKSAERVFQTAFKLSILISLIAALALMASAGFFADILILDTMSKKAIFAAAPVFVLTALVNLFRGYFNGNGFGVLVAHSQYLERISMLIAVVACSRLVYDYGLKVAALLQNDMVACSYGALGAVLGFMLAEIITLIYLLVVFVMYSGTRKRQLMQDSGRRVESNSEMMGILLGGSVPVACIAVLTNVFMLIDQRFLNYCMNRMELGMEKSGLWGSYYGKVAGFIGIGAALVCLSVGGYIGKIALSYEREEYHMMHDNINLAVKKLCVIAFPIAINLAVLAEAFINGFYIGENTQTISLLRQGCVIIFLYGIAYLFGQMLLKMRMMKELLAAAAIALVIHIAAVYVLVRKFLLGAEGIVYSQILFVGILALLCFLFSVRKLKHRQEWLYSVAFPAAAACVAGLVALLLNKVLLSVAGNLLTILVACLISTILYILLLMILRVMNEDELSRMPFGSIWIALGRMIGVL